LGLVLVALAFLGFGLGMLRGQLLATLRLDSFMLLEQLVGVLLEFLFLGFLLKWKTGTY